MTEVITYDRVMTERKEELMILETVCTLKDLVHSDMPMIQRHDVIIMINPTFKHALKFRDEEHYEKWKLKQRKAFALRRKI